MADLDLEKYKGLFEVSINGYVFQLYDFIEKFLWINDKETNTIIPFKLNEAQKELYMYMCESKLKGEPIREDVLKARQLGLSTFIAAVLYSMTLYNDNVRSCVIADIKEHAQNIFEIYQLYYSCMNKHYSERLQEEIENYPLTHNGKRHPKDLRPVLVKQRDGEVMKTVRNSRLEVIVAGEKSGRSAAYTMVHSSETAFQKDLQKTNVALFSTVSLNNPNSMIFIETTANGFNDYKTMWDSHVAKYARKESLFRPVFFPWFFKKEYRMKVPSSGLPLMEDWIYEKLRKYKNVDDEQVYYYWQTYQQGYTKDLMLQEYPWGPEDAFVSTGKSVFDMDKLAKRKEEIVGKTCDYGSFLYQEEHTKDGQSAKMLNVHFETMSGGHWKIYHYPKPNRHYVAICDPNKGRGVDDSAIIVAEQNTGLQCAVYKSKKDDIDYVAKQLCACGYFYNNALLSSENNTGPLVLEILVKFNYPNIYRSQDMVYQNVMESFRLQLGHNTNRGTRDKMISDFVIAFRDHPEIIEDIDTLNEMESFQYVQSSNGTVKAEAASTTVHDDLVTAYMPFWTIRLQQPFDDDAPIAKELKSDYSFATLNDMVQRKKQKSNNTNQWQKKTGMRF